MTNSPVRAKPQRASSRSIRSRAAPAGSGVNLLNSGAMTVGIEHQHEQLESHPRDPRVEPPHVPARAHQPQHEQHERQPEHARRRAMPFARSASHSCQRHAVEAEALLDAERVPPRERQADDAADAAPTPTNSATSRHDRRRRRALGRSRRAPRARRRASSREHDCIDAPSPASPRRCLRDGVVGGLACAAASMRVGERAAASRRDARGRAATWRTASQKRIAERSDQRERRSNQVNRRRRHASGAPRIDQRSALC